MGGGKPGRYLFYKDYQCQCYGDEKGDGDGRCLKELS